MALIPFSAPIAPNQPDSCAACAERLSKRNQSGFCRRCFGRYNDHPRPRHSSYDRDKLTRASRSRLAWCPVDLLPEYRRLTRITGLRAKEARAIIEKHMAVQAARSWRKAA